MIEDKWSSVRAALRDIAAQHSGPPSVLALDIGPEDAAGPISDAAQTAAHTGQRADNGAVPVLDQLEAAAAQPPPLDRLAAAKASVAHKALVDAGLLDRSYAAAVARAEQRRASRNGTAPQLWTPERLIATRQDRLDAMAATAERWAWSDTARLRLLDRDTNARDARHDLSLDVFDTDFATWPAAERDELLDLFAEDCKADEEIMDLRGEIRRARLLNFPNAVPLYEQMCHLWFGTQESLKTLMLLHVACLLAERGQHSLIFEYEIGQELLKQNIEDLGFDRERMAEYIHIAPVEAQLSTGLVLHWLGKFPEVALIGLDNVTEAMSLIPDSSENAAQDVNRTLRIFRNLSHKRGIVSVLIDHTGHTEGRARGSSVKAHIVDVMCGFKQSTFLTREQVGVLDVDFTKDRGSLLGRGAKRSFEVGDGHGALPVEPSERTGPAPGVRSPRQERADRDPAPPAPKAAGIEVEHERRARSSLASTRQARANHLAQRSSMRSIVIRPHRLPVSRGHRERHDHPMVVRSERARARPTARSARGLGVAHSRSSEPRRADSRAPARRGRSRDGWPAE